jgi:phosphoribosyl 1,2-cyclic phosphate phosphodiesterase
MSDNPRLKFTVLGSGTSSGIPTISCQCPTCTSTDQKDKRLRCSLLVESENTTVVIDTSPDFRQQMLRAGVNKLDAVIYTHHHFDHIGGFDDIRAFNYTSRQPMKIYAMEKTHNELKRTFIYAFEVPEQMGGGVPMVEVDHIDDCKFRIGDIDIIPLFLLHGRLEVLGFRIGNLAYCTDTNYIPEESIKKLKGVEVLIIDALRYTPHSTHFNVEEAVRAARRINPDITYLTHIAHQIKHRECEHELPEDIKIAYDGLEIII